MNTLQDLRATLDRAADQIDDTERYTRSGAVHARVRVVRRRRVATVAVAATVVLIAAVAAAGLVLRSPKSIEPAGVLGVDVPHQVEVGGITYTLDDVRRVTPGEPTMVSDTDALRAERTPVVSLIATGLGDGSAMLSTNGEPMTRLFSGKERSVPVGADQRGLVSVQVDLHDTPDDAQVGVAVYTPDGTLPPFPADDGDRTLADSSFAAPGQSAASVTVEGSLDGFDLDAYCVTDDHDLYVQIEVDGKFDSGTACASDATNAHTGTTGAAAGIRGGGTHVVRAVVTRGDLGDPEAIESGTVLGIGVYRPTAQRTVLDYPVAETVDWGGRRWTLDQVIDQDAPGETIRRTLAPSDGDRLLGYVTRGGADVWWNGDLVGREHDSFPSMGGSAWDFRVAALLAGDRYQLTGAPSSPDAEVALLVYRPE